MRKNLEKEPNGEAAEDDEVDEKAIELDLDTNWWYRHVLECGSSVAAIDPCIFPESVGMDLVSDFESKEVESGLNLDH